MLWQCLTVDVPNAFRCPLLMSENNQSNFFRLGTFDLKVWSYKMVNSECLTRAVLPTQFKRPIIQLDNAWHHPSDVKSNAANTSKPGYHFTGTPPFNGTQTRITNPLDCTLLLFHTAVGLLNKNMTHQFLSHLRRPVLKGISPPKPQMCFHLRNEVFIHFSTITAPYYSLIAIWICEVQ